MSKIVLYFGAGVCVGLGTSCWQTTGDRTGTDFAEMDYTAIERRLLELDNALARERSERQTLGGEVASIRGTIAALTTLPYSEESRGGAPASRASALAERKESELSVEQVDASIPRLSSKSAEDEEQFLRQQRIERFIAAGIAPGSAQEIIMREEELEMEALRAKYDAVQAGASFQEAAKIKEALIYSVAR